MTGDDKPPEYGRDLADFMSRGRAAQTKVDELVGKVEGAAERAAKVDRAAHIKRHVDLHRALDELMADYVGHTRRLLGQTTMIEFMQWSYEQTLNPTEPDQ